MTAAQMFSRIAELDRMFDGALGWGSWMVEAANEREGLVNQLRTIGHDVEHRFQARCGDKRTD